MKILCISDQIDPLIYSSSAKERFADIDLVLCAGDLSTDYIDFVVSTLNKPTYFVFGNHNLNDFPYYHKTAEHGGYIMTDRYELNHSHGAVYTGFKTKREQNLLLAGASGSIRYNNGQCQYTDRQMFMSLLKMVPSLIRNKMRYGRYLDIFLTHAPPLGIHDKKDPCHTGFKCYLWFLRKFKPKYMIHGHIHLYDIQDQRITPFDSTIVINAFSHYILEIPDPVTREKTKKLKKNTKEE